MQNPYPGVFISRDTRKLLYHTRKLLCHISIYLTFRYSTASVTPDASITKSSLKKLDFTILSISFAATTTSSIQDLYNHAFDFVFRLLWTIAFAFFGNLSIFSRNISNQFIPSPCHMLLCLGQTQAVHETRRLLDALALVVKGEEGGRQESYLKICYL